MVDLGRRWVVVGIRVLWVSMVRELAVQQMGNQRWTWTLRFTCLGVIMVPLVDVRFGHQITFLCLIGV